MKLSDRFIALSQSTFNSGDDAKSSISDGSSADSTATLVWTTSSS